MVRKKRGCYESLIYGMHGMTFDLETWFMGRMYKLTNIVRLQSGILIIETLKN